MATGTARPGFDDDPPLEPAEKSLLLCAEPTLAAMLRRVLGIIEDPMVAPPRLMENQQLYGCFSK